jgi:hypothetical protein
MSKRSRRLIFCHNLQTFYAEIIKADTAAIGAAHAQGIARWGQEET